MEAENWMPLESNPEVINAFITKMGLKTEFFSFQQILSTQEWALEMLPQPVLGIVFLFEETPSQQAHKQAQSETLAPEAVPKNLFFMKQEARNACGTIALFHIILNGVCTYPQIIANDSYLHKFKQNSHLKTPKEIAVIFKESKQILQEHKSAANQGQSQVHQICNAHFIAFVPFEGRLYELDGCKKCAVDHGPCLPEQFLKKGVQTIKAFIQRDPENNNFSMIALAKNAEM